MNLDQDACIITSTAEHDSTSHPEMDELILTKNVDIAYNGLLLIISSTGPGRVFISDEWMITSSFRQTLRLNVSISYMSNDMIVHLPQIVLRRMLDEQIRKDQTFLIISI